MVVKVQIPVAEGGYVDPDAGWVVFEDESFIRVLDFFA